MTETKNYGIIPYEGYHVQNNAWGYRREDPPQSVFAPPGDGLGWAWRWKGYDSSQVISYPSIIYGKKPFNSDNTGSLLPRKIDDLLGLQATYSINTLAHGAFNTAFELWLTNSPEATRESITTEIMVWVGSDKVLPAGRKIADVPTEAYGEAELYHDIRREGAQQWHYYAYRLKQKRNAGTIDFLVFLGDLFRRNCISLDDYVASVEFGNEIAYGEGKVLVGDYSVQVS